MAGPMRAARLTRRRLLATAGSSAAITFLGGISKPYLSRASDRPRITHGFQSGDVSVDSGVVWARTDRPARMLVEVSTSDSFVDVRDAVAVDVLPESDFTAGLRASLLGPFRFLRDPYKSSSATRSYCC
jgi:alkaline phosphatase D